MVWPESSTTEVLKGVTVDTTGTPRSLFKVWSAVIAIWLLSPRIKEPPTVACFLSTLASCTAVAPLRASKYTEPFCVTLVVAEMRPRCSTAQPTMVVLPVGVLMLPLLTARSASTMLPLTSTNKPLSAGTFTLTSDMYKGDDATDGWLRNTSLPAASTVWPEGVVIVPAFSTLPAIRNTRPPDGVVISALPITRT